MYPYSTSFTIVRRIIFVFAENVRNINHLSIAAQQVTYSEINKLRVFEVSKCVYNNNCRYLHYDLQNIGDCATIIKQFIQSRSEFYLFLFLAYPFFKSRNMFLQNTFHSKNFRFRLFMLGKKRQDTKDDHVIFVYRYTLYTAYL